MIKKADRGKQCDKQGEGGEGGKAKAGEEALDSDENPNVYTDDDDAEMLVAPPPSRPPGLGFRIKSLVAPPRPTPPSILFLLPE